MSCFWFSSPEVRPSGRVSFPALVHNWNQSSECVAGKTDQKPPIHAKYSCVLCFIVSERRLKKTKMYDSKSRAAFSILRCGTWRILDSGTALQMEEPSLTLRNAHCLLNHPLSSQASSEPSHASPQQQFPGFSQIQIKPEKKRHSSVKRFVLFCNSKSELLLISSSKPEIYNFIPSNGAFHYVGLSNWTPLHHQILCFPFIIS